MNVWLVCGGQAVATMIQVPMFTPMWDTDLKGRYFPVMATEIPTTDNGGVVELPGNKMRVTIKINPAAHWSDGKPITCADEEFGWKLRLNDKYLIGSRLGWELIERIECPDPRTAQVYFKEPYAPYLRLLSSTPLPKHELEGKDFNTYWNDRITVSSGPFRFRHWKRNVEIRLERDPDFWNAGKDDKPYLDGLRFRFLKDTNTLKIQLRTGEVDWITPPPDTTLLDELRTFPRSEFQSEPGGYWEQLAFQTEAEFTSDVNVRKALAYAVDRKQMADVVLRKQAPVLNSTLLPAAKEFFQPAWSIYQYDEKKVAEHLEKAGFTRKGKWWEKDGKPLKVLFKSTAGNQLRAKVAQLLQQAYRRNGIQMEILMEDPAVFFSQSATSGAYQIALWAWSSDVDPTQTSLFACDQVPSKKNDFEGNNNYRYCNKEVTKLLYDADRAPVREERAALLRQVQTKMAEDVAVLPLYQRPETLAYSKRMHGVRNNPLAGSTWDTHEWWVSD